jgi:hypothetical protein
MASAAVTSLTSTSHPPHAHLLPYRSRVVITKAASSPARTLTRSRSKEVVAAAALDALQVSR